MKLSMDLDDPVAVDLLTSRRGLIAQFTELLLPLINLYGLPSKGIHVFYESAANAISFNQNGSIFLNLRYYETWREFNISIIVEMCNHSQNVTDDGAVRGGDSSQAHMFWYTHKF